MLLTKKSHTKPSTYKNYNNTLSTPIIHRFGKLLLSKPTKNRHYSLKEDVVLAIINDPLISTLISSSQPQFPHLHLSFPTHNFSLPDIFSCGVLSALVFFLIYYIYMGAGFSVLATQNSAINLPSKPNLEDLPESCIALILSCLDPSDICKVARTTKIFRRASLSDSVWESKLPENHQILVKKLLGSDEWSKSLSKKEIYARLSRPIRFAAGTKEVWLDKGRGGICVAISWKGMKITGIDDRRYWTHIPTHESRFQTITHLQQIWWLEIEGNLEFEFPVGTYSLFFRLHLGRPSKGLTGRRSNVAEKINGWDIKPVKFLLESSNGQHAISQCFLEEHGKWLHHHVGDFTVDNSNIPTVLKFSMTQIDCTHTKGGLCLDSVFIFPSH